ncbi:MAG: hypothetical protein KatS3mg057_0936 [Herpetosiphonaceae bacterium]|nr:MAG: hypothetical protein KatS3mg057_0936 [Herpetosiphonaceae bacterium]
MQRPRSSIQRVGLQGPDSPVSSLIIAGFVSSIMAFIPGFTLLSYPFRLLITVVHELGHGLAALLTGGSFINFVIFANGAGLAYTAGGWRWVVIPAGYLGTALFAAAFIRLSRSPRLARATLSIAGVAIILLSLRYGIPSIFSRFWLNGLFTVVSGVALGGACLGVALKTTPGWRVFVLNLIAIQAGLTAFSDVIGLVGITTRFFTTPANDAASMAALTGIPAVIWAILWAALAVALIGWAIWSTWLRRPE